MKTIAKNKPWKFLFWFGPFLIAAGLTAGLVSDNWGALPLVLIILGGVIVGWWLVWQSQKTHWWRQRSTQAGTNALVATLAVLAILGLINFLGTRYHARVDLTETKLFTLAPQSRELVRSLQVPTKVWVFDVNQDPVDRDLLENYRRQSSKFNFEYVDPQARLGLARKFGVKDYGEVYIESGEKRQLVQVVGPQERLSEVKLTNRLQQITSLSTAKVYFLQGHGEHQLSAGEGAITQAVQALNDKNYTTSTLNLAEKSSVPQDAAVVVVAGPKRALFENEVKALQDYLNRGGNLLLMIDPNTDPRLDSLLAQWGVKLDNRLAVDVSGSVGLGPAAPIVTEYGKHPITKDFGNGISFYPLARPIDTTSVAGIQATPLLLTKPYPNSWAESDQQSENLKFNPESDRKGPLTLGVALTRKPSAQSQALPNPTPPVSPTSPASAESRMVVLGNSDFAVNGLFEKQLNGDIFLNSVTWLSQQDQQPLSISPKEAKDRRINLTAAQANLLELSSLLILPMIGLVAAAILWWLRR
ncbi:ABC transporter [Nostocales cyanobacterium HT-58-2]|nr:ABC transporter [Nostocales cyanobacterium HT-58-2]